MTLRIFTAVMVMVAAAGCSTMVTHQTATTSLESAQACCDAMSQFNYLTLKGEADIQINLDASSAAFNFPTGKSYFAGFLLREWESAYKITIQSFALGEVIDKAHIFYPQIDLLDERFNLIFRSDPKMFTLIKAGFSETASKTRGLPVKLEGEIVIDRPSMKYMVVYTTPALMRERSPYAVQRLTPVILPGLVGAIPTGTETISIPHSPFGLLFFELQP